MASSSPMRIPAGFTQDTSFQPLGMLGVPNPFFYAKFADDFMHYNVDDYTVTANTNGGVAQTVGGVGGRITFTTNSSTPLAADITAVQSVSATVLMAATKKTAWLARIQAASITAPVLQIGLMQETVTPATIVTGMLATRAHSATAWVFQMVVGSTVVGSATVTDAVSGYAANTDIDLAMVYTGRGGANGAGQTYGDVLCYIGSNLVGQILDQNRATLGPMARFNPTSIPAAVMAPTLAMQSGAAASTTMIADFLFAAQER